MNNTCFDTWFSVVFLVWFWGGFQVGMYIAVSGYSLSCGGSQGFCCSNDYQNDGFCRAVFE